MKDLLQGQYHMANTQTDNNKPKPLIPLEYCSPERAARMLGCEVEDIFHWASVGAITIYAEFHFHEGYPSGSDGFLVREIITEENVPCYKSRGISDEDEVVSEGYYETPHGLFYGKMYPMVHDCSPYDEKTLDIEYGPKGFEYDSSLFIPEPNQGMFWRTVYLSGLWAIESRDISMMQFLSPQWDEMLWDIDTTYIGIANNDVAIDENKIFLQGVKIDGIKERLRIVRDDINKIQKHILSGEVMERVSHRKNRHDSDAHETFNKKRHVTERHAETREKVLAAAIRALNEWPGECYGKDGQMNGTAWASAVHDHAVALFGSESAPLSLPSTINLLNAAIKGGVVHKKK